MLNAVFPSRETRRRIRLRPIAVLALTALGAVVSPSHAGAPAEFVTGRILVMPRAGLPDAALGKILRDGGAGKARRVGKTALRIVELPPGTERAMVERLGHHPHIKFAELDRLVPPGFTSNDPYIGSEWHIPKIGAPSAWDSAQGAGVTIAILDTGVDGTHPDLAPRMVSGWNWYDNNADTSDVYGHGTKVAGSAAAAGNNGIGVTGVAGQARIMPIRVSDLQGYASWSALTQGIAWAADHGARVVNISYVVANSAAVISAANYMKSKGGLVVTSAGNYGTDALIAPTTAMIPVSATDSADNKTSWSSYGDFVAVSAPGAGIYTTAAGGGYASVSGTSFSSPITAGVIGLMMSANPALSSTDVEGLLYSTAVDLGAAGRDPYFGYGRVNATAAVQAALYVTPQPDQQSPTVAITAPSASSTVSGLAQVDVASSDNVGVVSVELRANGVLVGTDTTAPYAFSWDTSGTTNGMASLVATARDAAGNRQSMSVSVNVANNLTVDTTAPSVAISDPADGQSVSGNVAIKVSATDDGDIAAIQQSLYINGQRVATGSGGLLQYRWNTRKVASGTYRIEAVAVDGAGNSASNAITVSR